MTDKISGLSSTNFKDFKLARYSSELSESEEDSSDDALEEEDNLVLLALNFLFFLLLEDTFEVLPLHKRDFLECPYLPQEGQSLLANLHFDRPMHCESSHFQHIHFLVEELFSLKGLVRLTMYVGSFLICEAASSLDSMILVLEINFF